MALGEERAGRRTAGPPKPSAPRSHVYFTLCADAIKSVNGQRTRALLMQHRSELRLTPLFRAMHQKNQVDVTGVCRIAPGYPTPV